MNFVLLGAVPVVLERGNQVTPLLGPVNVQVE